MIQGFMTSMAFMTPWYLLSVPALRLTTTELPSTGTLVHTGTSKVSEYAHSKYLTRDICAAFPEIMCLAEALAAAQ